MELHELDFGNKPTPPYSATKLQGFVQWYHLLASKSGIDPGEFGLLSQEGETTFVVKLGDNVFEEILSFQE